MSGAAGVARRGSGHRREVSSATGTRDGGRAGDGGTDDDPLATLGSDFAAGQEEAVARAWELFAPDVLRLARRRGLDEHDAQDVLQETFVSAWRSRSGFDPARGRLPGWLLAVAARRVADHHGARTRARRQQEASSRVVPPAPDEPADDVVAGLVVETELRALPARRRRVVSLVVLDGLSHAQVAGMTGLPLGTVKSDVRRGLARLRAARATGVSAP